MQMRTITFTMEDALISPIGLSILTGAGLIEASQESPVIQHIAEVTETFAEGGVVEGGIYVDNEPYAGSAEGKTDKDCFIYVMGLDDHGEVVTEPYYFIYDGKGKGTNGKYLITLAKDHAFTEGNYTGISSREPVKLANASSVMVDYYTARTSGAMQIDITPDKFGGTFYLEASTLWRDQGTGKDLPAEFIIPSCKVQSNFSFTLASSGDPSSFTFTMDAFPDYTRFNHTKKVLAEIQVVGMTEEGAEEAWRTETWSLDDEDSDGIVRKKTATATSEE